MFNFVEVNTTNLIALNLFLFDTPNTQMKLLKINSNQLPSDCARKQSKATHCHSFTGIEWEYRHATRELIKMKVLETCIEKMTFVSRIKQQVSNFLS